MVRTKLLTGAAASAVAWSASAAVCYTRARSMFGVHSHLGSAAQHRGFVGLTFDDGPQQGVTDRYLDLLRDRQITATFFVVGEQAVRAPKLLERMVAEGHDVQSHGFHHRNHLLRAPWSPITDLPRATATIESITGLRPTLYRPPQGVITPATLRAARSEQQDVVLWSTWARDWERRATPASIARRAGTVPAGGILLLHDADHYSYRSWHATWDALPAMLDDLARRGLHPCSLRDAALVDARPAAFH